MHARVSAGEKGWGVLGNMLRRGESSWLCMKFEFAFVAGNSIFDQVLPSSFLALPVNELCLLFCLTLLRLDALCCTFFV